MAWPGYRVLPMIGSLCLAGQGVLLMNVGSGGKHLPVFHSWVFLGLTVVLAVLLALAISTRREIIGRQHGIGLVTLLLGIGGMLACNTALLVQTESDDNVTLEDDGSTAADFRYRANYYQDLVLAMEEIAADVADKSCELTAVSPGARANHSRLFQFLTDYAVPSRLVGDFSEIHNMNLIIWHHGQPVAWTAGSHHLPLPRPDQTERVNGKIHGRVLVQGRHNWFLQDVQSLAQGLSLEIQIPVPVSDVLQVVRKRLIAAAVNTQGLPAQDLELNLTGETLSLQLVSEGAGKRGRYHKIVSRMMFLLVMAWLATVVAVAGVWLGPIAFILTMWLIRIFLAFIDFSRWVAPAFPNLAFPAEPASFASLVDPAYFATPFAFGWFASAADALLTAVLIAATVFFLLRLNNPFTVNGRLRMGFLNHGLISGAVFGVLSTVVLILIRALAVLLAENANARLVGPGVDLPSLSFWALHMVLLLGSFSLLALLSHFVRGPAPTDETTRLRWLAGGVLAASMAFLVTIPVAGMWWGIRLVLGVVILGLWFLAPTSRATPHFLRRSFWPVLLLLTVVWNYSSLREVYDLAERNWLDRKGSLMVESSEEWMKFLLADVLGDMRTHDAEMAQAIPGTMVQEGDLWRDETAFRLWKDSALSDLGMACLVETMDESGNSESLFGQGYLRDFQYEVVRRGPWLDDQGHDPPVPWNMIFQSEVRMYPGGDEVVLVAEIVREHGVGWIRVELPVRSRRISTLVAGLVDSGESAGGGYRPRMEVDRDIILLRGDNNDWLATGDHGFPGPESELLLAELRSGELDLAVIKLDGKKWLCRWQELPREDAQSPGEGYLLGLHQADTTENALDLSRMLLLDLILFVVIFLLIQILRGFAIWVRGTSNIQSMWHPGFQERFLMGYMLLGLVLLVVVGASMDKVGSGRIQAEAHLQTREGLSMTIQQLRNLLVEQARSLAGSEYIADLLANELTGGRPAGPLHLKQGMVFGAGGQLLLDETLGNFTDEEALVLLEAGRTSPLVIIKDRDDLYVGAVIPIDLADVLAAVAASDSSSEPLGHGSVGSEGFFFYRQRLEGDLLAGLADLVRGEVTLSLGGRPYLASHSASVFTEKIPAMTPPGVMRELLDHPAGSRIFTAAGGPFSFTGYRPLPAFIRSENGHFARHDLPAVLAVSFPDRERESVAQRRETVLFMAGLANLVLVTALILALLLSWNIFRPLRLLMAAVRSLARGDYDAPLPEEGTDEVGRLSHAFGSMRHELASAQNALAQRERFLTQVLDRVTVGVGVIDETGMVVALNPAGRHILTEFSPHLSDDEGTRSLLEGFQGLAVGKDRAQGELRSKDGKRTLRGAMAPLNMPDGGSDVMLVFEDITEFLSNKMMAINAELARQVAHEIKNPLTPIQLSIQLLDQAWQDQHPKLGQIVPDTVARVLEQVSLLRSIAAEFSLLGRPGELDRKPLDLWKIVEEVAQTYGARQIDPSCEVNIENDPDGVPLVSCDRDSLWKILGNLMQNSLDAVEDGTLARIDVSWRITATTVTLLWADNGTGLEAEVASRLFDPYFSTKSKGTGLGLAICRNLSDRMGGTITLGNRSDADGALAELTLPRSMK